MPQEQSGTVDLKGLGLIAWIIIGLFAPAFRVAFHGCLTVGRWSVNVWSLLSVFVAYPASVQWWGPPITREGAQIFSWYWLFLIGQTVVQFVVSKRGSNDAHAEEVGEPLLGLIGGFFAPVLVSGMALPHVPGVAFFVVAGLACNAIQIQLIHMRWRRMAIHAANRQKEFEVLRELFDEETTKR